MISKGPLQAKPFYGSMISDVLFTTIENFEKLELQFHRYHMIVQRDITSSVSSQVYVSTVTPVWFCCIQFVTQGIQQAFILRITADSKDTMKRRLSLYEDERPVTDSYLIVLYNWPAVITFHFIRTIKHKFKDCVKWSQCWERTDTSKPLEKQFLLKSFVHSFHEVLHLNTIMLRLDSLLVLWEGSLYLYILRSLNANKNIFRKEDSH